MGQYSLDESEYQAVNAGAAGTVKTAAVARLYTSPDGAWHYANLWGAAAVVTDESDIAYIRIIDLASSQILWEQEFYEGIDYQSPTPFFHTFEGSESVVGLSFADEEDAGYFYSAVTSLASSYKAGDSSSSGSYSSGVPNGGGASNPPLPPKPALRSPGPAPPSIAAGGPPPRPAGGPPPRPSEAPPAPPSRPAYTPDPYPSNPTPSPMVPPPQPVTPVAAAPAHVVSSPSQPEQKKGSFISGGGGGGSKRNVKKKGWFSKITEKIGLGEEQEPDIVLGGPTGFRHESHIGWDPSAGFEIRNIPPEWRKLFQAAGVKKSELKDGATAQFIMETVVEATMGMNPVAGTPPPPPRPGGGPPPVPGTAPPPPPPGHSAPMAPPPPSAPMAPPPPSAPNAPSAPSAPPPPSFSAHGGGGGGGLLAGLQSAQLKSVDRSVPDLKELDEAQGANLADTLAKAMAARRVDMGVDEPEDELGSEDEWSD